MAEVASRTVAAVGFDRRRLLHLFPVMFFATRSTRYRPVFRCLDQAAAGQRPEALFPKVIHLHLRLCLQQKTKRSEQRTQGSLRT